jgi:pyruvate/2-oxoglutarate dehydrogenase complex dihydrolipoamide acyltransferase (E2) component
MRPDGIRVRDMDPMYYLIPYFLKKKYDAMNMVTLDIPVEPLHSYMNAKRREGRSVSHLALILTAYLRTAEKFPAINRFIVNKKIYQHKDITVSMVVLRPESNDDTMSKIYLEATDTIFDVQRKIEEYIGQNRKITDTNLLDRAMKIICNLSLLMSFAIGLVKLLDRFGLLPKSLIKISPFHASLLISNLASIRTNHIYHHIYDFGTTSVSITMGNMREVPRRTRGDIVHDKCLPLGVVMDERICSGHYLAQAFAYLRELLKNPEQLETGKNDIFAEPDEILQKQAD